ncbi:MAG: hypothetical protein C0622_11155 [Desulfuromonas sp.]|nr:MAG: hypothetical protein C0622_11155 [Desulfuromonas sp.]
MRIPEIGAIYKNIDSSGRIIGTSRLVCISPWQIAYLIRLDDPPFRIPYPIPLSDLILLQQNKQILKINDFNFDQIPRNISQLSPAAQLKQQNNLRLMEPLIGVDSYIYNKNLRNQAFTDRAKEVAHDQYGASKCTIRILWLRYLAYNFSYIAFAPLYDRRGGTGQKQNPLSGRRGAKCKSPKSVTDVKLVDVAEQLTKGITKYYFTGKYTLISSYWLTMHDFFIDSQKLEKGGKKFFCRDILLPSHHLPTFRQFRYIKDKLEETGLHRTHKPRRQRQPKEELSITGSARAGLIGPGSRFEIDATKIQIRPVAEYDRSRLLEPPTLYIILDVWSGAITGYCLSLENEGWPLMTKALQNCYEDKQLTFERLGLQFTSEDWPCCHLPSKLSADRATLVSNKAGPCIEINGHIEIMPPYRADRKGSVENEIKRLKQEHDLKIPGSYPKNPQRGEDNGKKSAALTFVELERIIVRAIIDLNNEPVPEKYLPFDFDLTGDIPITYIGLYRWGLINRPGQTRVLDRKDIFLNLMSIDTGKLTEKGIYYKGFYYNCKKLEENGYITKAKRHGTKKIKISYYEKNADKIWYYDEYESDYIAATNTDEDLRRTKASFVELEIRHRIIDILRKEEKGNNIFKRLKNNSESKEEIDIAKKLASEDKKGKSPSEINTGIRQNNKLEISKMNNLTDFDILQNKESQQKLIKTLLPDNTIPKSKGRTPLDLWEDVE